MNADDRLDRLDTFLGQFEQTLSDALARMERDDGDGKAAASELVTHVAQLTEAVKKLKPADLSGLIAALRGLRAPENVINVPQPLVQFMPAPDADVTWEVRIPGQYGAADRLMTITKKAKP